MVHILYYTANYIDDSVSGTHVTFLVLLLIR